MSGAIARGSAWLAGLAKAGALSAGTLALRRTRTPSRSRRTRPRVAFLTEGDPQRHPTPAARYRVLQYLPHLEESGITCRVFPSKPGKFEWVSEAWERRRARWPRLGALGTKTILARQSLRRAWHFLRAAHDSALVLQRELLAAPELTLARYAPLFNARIVFDMDDALWRLSAWAPESEQRRVGERLERKIATLCGLAAACTVANPYLADFARQHCARVVVVPTTLDCEHFSPSTSRGAPSPQGLPVIGWAGTSGNLHYVAKIAPAIRALAERERFRLRIVCDSFPDDVARLFPDGLVDFLRWNARDEVERLRSFDIGIMPLEDEGWARGKAGFKLIQYMACGVPSVYSPVGANADVAGPSGGVGLAAHDHGEWVHGLQTLLRDADLRTRLGANARERALRDFDCRRWAKTLAELYRDVAREA